MLRIALAVIGAEKAGYKGFMVAVDAPRLGDRIADERNKWAAAPACIVAVACKLRLILHRLLIA